MDLMLRNKVAIVTGASKGIGMAVTEALADEGALVVGAARRISSLQGMENVTPVATDLLEFDASAELIKRTLDMHGRIDILVNNLGTARLRPKGFLAVSDEDFRWSLEHNLFSMLRASRAALRAMGEQNCGAVVNVTAGDFGALPSSSTIDFHAAKAAVASITKSLADEFFPQGIRINGVSPGPVSTDLWLGEGGLVEALEAARGLNGHPSHESLAARVEGSSSSRFVHPEEVATMVTYLASPRSAPVTGIIFPIDGNFKQRL
jgi:NAD(P)-dependent dehydrogenase (short-subunit alcohol dehydrogenase family)